MPPARPPRATSVAVIVTAGLVIVTTVVLGCFGLLNHLSERRRETAELNASVSMIAEQLATGLALPVWNFDHPQIDKVIESAMRHNEVAAVVVDGAGHRHTLRRNSRWEIATGDYRFSKEDLISESRLIAAGGSPVGTVTIYVTPRFMQAALRESLVSIIALILALDLILVLALYGILAHLVLKPLEEVDGFAKAVSSGRRATGAIGAGRRFYGELASLRGSIEKMVAELDARYAELNRAKMAADEAVGIRDDFLSIASHELKTPLTALQYAVQSLQRKLRRTLPEGANQFSSPIEITLRQVRRLANLVNTLLDVSVIRGGFLAMELVPTNLQEAIDQSVASLAPRLSTSGSPVTVVAPDEPIIGEWHPVRLEQLVTNLLDNAIKYGNGKPIRVELRQIGESACLSVSDQGLGIPLADQQRIFDRFERAVSSRHYGGLGLGLFICRSIVEALGGTITCESQPDAGTTFTVVLPLHPAQQAVA